jgi:hypothetical protein
MASLTSLDGLMFTANNVSENGFTPDFEQADGTVAAGGTVTIPDPGVPFFTDKDVGINDQQMIGSVDTSAANSYRLGTCLLYDVSTMTSPETCDIIGVNSGGVLLGVQPYDPTQYLGTFWPDGYIYLSNTDISESDGHTPNFPILLSGAPSAENTYNPPCFAKGTRISTPDGFALVEDLVAGDVVLTASGAHSPVVWTGSRHVDIARHPSPELVRPIRISAGAFADSMPLRDLLISPDHNLFVDGVLIPAKCLLNGASVAQLGNAEVTYYHVELAAHDVVLAENMPTESYLDTGNRNSFAGQGVTVAHPDFASAPDVNFFAWEAKGCAKLVLSGPEVDRVRAMLAARVMAAAPAEAARAA